jgi:hypothetical protein
MDRTRRLEPNHTGPHGALSSPNRVRRGGFARIVAEIPMKLRKQLPTKVERMDQAAFVSIIGV